MMPSKDELISIVDAALDDARQRLKVTTDEQLANTLNVSPKTISFLRNGRWTQVDTAIITVLVSALHYPVTS